MFKVGDKVRVPYGKNYSNEGRVGIIERFIENGQFCDIGKQIG